MASANLTVIGRASRVRGNLTGEGDLEVQGFVAGDIAVSGDVTVDAQGLVDANVHGRRVVVRGAIRGNLTADESIALEEGARVVGDLRAPRVAIGQGALVRGYVQTGEGVPASTASGRARGQAVETSSAARAQAARAAASRQAPPPPRAAPAPPARPAAKAETAAETQASNSNSHGVARRPPPPVVPALKKMKGQILKKKER
jgi:cytoskeletal protein CcmA (bactofilin family)